MNIELFQIKRSRIQMSGFKILNVFFDTTYSRLQVLQYRNTNVRMPYTHHTNPTHLTTRMSVNECHSQAEKPEQNSRPAPHKVSAEFTTEFPQIHPPSHSCTHLHQPSMGVAVYASRSFKSALIRAKVNTNTTPRMDYPYVPSRST